jgi:hypothetical protein
MFDHITLRVADLAFASGVFAAALDELEIEQTTTTPSFSVWGNFALTQTDEDHPIARRVHIAFIAPTPAHVDRFWQAALMPGSPMTGPRPSTRSTRTTTTPHRSKTPPATASKPYTLTVRGREAALITS